MSLQCWKCGASLAGVPLPLGRREVCPSCQAELHVCRMCRHYDARRAGQCRELAADEVKNKTRANFCDWFQPKAAAFIADTSSGTSRGNPLDELFGSSSAARPKSDAKSELDKLFGKG